MSHKEFPERRPSPEGPRAAGALNRRGFMAAGAGSLAALAIGAGSTEASQPTPVAGSVPEGGRRAFEGRVVLITGATSGIGEATARAFAAEGARVFFCGRRAELGERVAASIREAGGEATFMQADVREDEQVAAFVASCVSTYGRLDVAFNNAGIEGAGNSPSVEGRGTIPHIRLEGFSAPTHGIEPRELSYSDVMRTNLDGVFFSMRHELPVMQRQGSGVIINTASIQGSRGSAGSPAYSASKHGVIGLSRSAALANAEYGIRVLSVSPGPVDTPLLRRLSDGGDLSEYREQNPLGVAKPYEIASMVVHLASPAASFMTGVDVTIDGGSTAA